MTHKISPFSYLLVFCIPVLLYIQTLSFGLTQFDDTRIIEAKHGFLSDFSNIPQAFSTDAFIEQHGTFYRPLQTVSFMIDAQFCDAKEPWMFHLTNILLLGIIGVLLFVFLKKFQISQSLALIGTLIFCIHPLFVSTVAWIPARGDLLLTIFALLSFIFLIEFIKTKKQVYSIFHVLAFVLALFCKETAVILPILFILYLLIFTKEFKFNKTFILISLFYVLAIVLMLLMRSIITGHTPAKNDIFGLLAILSNIRTFAESLSLLFIPIIAPIPEFTVLKTLIGILLLSVFVYIIFKSKPQFKKESLFFLAWFVLLMLPPMLFKGGLIDYLCHRFMLPLIGILLLLLKMIPEKWLEHKLFKKQIVPIPICIILALLSFINTQAYDNPMTYFTEAVNRNNNSALAYNSLGKLNMINGNYRDAIEDMNRAILILPSFTVAYSDRGNIQYHLGNMQAAINDYTKSIALNQNDGDSYYNRGTAYYGQADYKNAIADFTTAVTIRPNDAEAYNYRGSAYGSLGNLPEALDNFDKAIACNQTYLAAYYNRAKTKYIMKDEMGAIKDCDIILKLHPDDERAMSLRISALKQFRNKILK